MDLQKGSEKLPFSLNIRGDKTNGKWNNGNRNRHHRERSGIRLFTVHHSVSRDQKRYEDAIREET